MKQAAAEIERTKLTANFINSIASGTVLAALVGPFIGVGLGTMPSQDTWNIAGLSLLGLVVALVLHSLARRLLAGLEE